MVLDTRKANILQYIIRDYVQSAKPVSSGRIFKHNILDLSPATIRGLMQELDDEGYLFQPHTSSGRAPTEKGYKYFVENIMRLDTPNEAVMKIVNNIFGDFDHEFENAFEELSRVLARHLRLFSGVGILDKHRVFGHGLSEVLREPEFNVHSEAIKFADYIENIGDDLEHFANGNRFDTDPTITISDFSSVKILIEDDDLGKCVIFSFGPKRMNYEKTASVLKFAARGIIKNNKKKHAAE